MRVLIAGYCSFPSPDSRGVQLGHVMDALERGGSLDVLCVRREEQAYVERRGESRILRVPVADEAGPAREATFQRALRRQVEGAEYDLIIVCDAASCRTAVEKKKDLGFAVVFDAGRSPLALHWDGSGDDVQTRMADLVPPFEDVDLVLVPTLPAQQYFASLLDSAKVHHVPLGVDINLFDWDDPPRDGTQRLVVTGAVAGARNLDVTVEAIADVATDHPICLVLAGEVDEEFMPQFRSKIASLGLEDHVEIVGELEHRAIPELLASATICIAPSASELDQPTAVYPTKILEYLACRRPVVAPRSGTVTMLMRDRQHGLLYSPGDRNELAAQLSALLTDPAMSERLAHAGYEMVRREHAASSTRRSLRHALQWLGDQAPWKQRWSRESDEFDSVPPMAKAAVSMTDSLALAGSAIPFAAGVALEAEDLTIVETSPGARRAESDPGDTMESRLVDAGSGDDWVVGTATDTRAAPAEGEFSTVVQGEPLSFSSDDRPADFVAGEFEVPSSLSGNATADESGADEQLDGDTQGEGDGEPSFVAMSKPLGQIARAASPAAADGEPKTETKGADNEKQSDTGGRRLPEKGSGDQAKPVPQPPPLPKSSSILDKLRRKNPASRKKASDTSDSTEPVPE